MLLKIHRPKLRNLEDEKGKGSLDDPRVTYVAHVCKKWWVGRVGASCSDDCGDFQRQDEREFGPKYVALRTVGKKKRQQC